MNHASVFSGIGGPEIAATMLGWDNVFHCEINPFGRAVLDYWYPKAKSYEDITKTDFSEWRGRVDVLTGGFPCQPFSYAGQRRGATDDRYLWPYMFRCIDQVQPTWVVAENVAGITTMVEQGEVSPMESQGTLFDEVDRVPGYRLRETFTLQRICDDLEGHGYEVQPVLVPACAVGAPHRRDRVFIIGHRVAADSDERADRRAAREDAGKGGEERLQERHEVRKSDEPGEVRPEGAALPQDTMHGGQLHGRDEEQGSERHIGDAGAGCGERLRGETSRAVASDSSDTGFQKERPEQQATGASGTISSVVSNTGFKRLERKDESVCGEGGQRLHLRRDGTRCSGEAIPDPDNHRGSEVDEHMESELADGAEPFSNGRQRNVADTESEQGDGVRPRQSKVGRAQQEQPRGRGGEDGGVAGCGRWAKFPTVSPVCGRYDGLSRNVVRYINEKVYDELKEHFRNEDLPRVWQVFQSPQVRQSIGRLYKIHETDLLLKVVFGAQTGRRPESDGDGLSARSDEVSERVLRKLRKQRASSCASQRLQHQEQLTRELGYALPALSFDLALAAKTIEEEVLRMMTYVRTESLKAYGNAIVPQVMYEIFRAIQIVENQLNKC